MARLQETFETALGAIREDLARGVISDTEFEAREDAAVERFRQRVLDLITALRSAGDITDQQARKFIAALPETDDAKKTEESFTEIARQIEQAGRGAVQLGQAMGVVDDETARAFQHAVQLAASLPEAVAGDPAAILSGLGALVSIFAGDPETKRIARENTLALERLTAGVARLGGALASTGGGDLGAIASATRGTLLSGETDVFNFQLRDFERRLSALGLTFEDAQAVADGFGITLDGTRESFEAFDAALQQFRLDQLFETFAGQLRLLDTELDLLDITDPLERLQRTRALFLEAVDLGPEMESFLADINLSTAEGRAAFDEAIRNLFQNLGSLDPAALGELSVEEFLDIIRQMENLGDALAELEDTTHGVNSALLNVPSGFKINLERFRATEGAIDPTGFQRGGQIIVHGDIVLVDPDPQRLHAQVSREAVRSGRRGGSNGFEFVGRP
jgi:hypothetical protein